ncbi:hypothetical protein K1719_042320 [Acacia pycnantha]|nr:hypothetical protein K1719_042320 [Acacia pycnantha]
MRGCERLAYCGIAKNLVTYLTRRLREGHVSGARNVPTWQGPCYFTPLVGAFLADAYWGRYLTIVVFSTIYFIVKSEYQFGVIYDPKFLPWRLCTVTLVEELKILIIMFPIWATGIVLSAVYAKMSTMFVEQGTMMDASINSFTIPAASLSTFDVLSVIFWVPIYDRIIVPIARKFTGKERGFSECKKCALSLLTTSLGNYLSSFIITIVSYLTTQGGRAGWIPDNLNEGPSRRRPLEVYVICILPFELFDILQNDHLYPQFMVVPKITFLLSPNQTQNSSSLIVTISSISLDLSLRLSFLLAKSLVLLDNLAASLSKAKTRICKALTAATDDEAISPEHVQILHVCCDGQVAIQRKTEKKRAWIMRV